MRSQWIITYSKADEGNSCAMVPVNYNNALICRTLIHVRECNFGCYLLQQIVTKYVFRRLLLGYVSRPYNECNAPF